jgi:hypothetical protein
MAHMTMTRELAFAAGTDAANTLMRKRGLKKWSLIERNVAAAVTNRLCSHIYPEPIASELRREADEGIAWLAEQGFVQKPGVLSFLPSAA